MSYILLFFFSFFPFSWSELQLYARPLGTLFSLGSLALWMVLNCVYVAPFFFTIRARRRPRAEIFVRKNVIPFPISLLNFFFLLLQSRIKFSLSFPDRRATYVVEVLRPHLRHPIIIRVIKTLRSGNWLGNKVSFPTPRHHQPQSPPRPHHLSHWQQQVISDLPGSTTGRVLFSFLDWLSLDDSS